MERHCAKNRMSVISFLHKSVSSDAAAKYLVKVPGRGTLSRISADKSGNCGVQRMGSQRRHVRVSFVSAIKEIDISNAIYRCGKILCRGKGG